MTDNVEGEVRDFFDIPNVGRGYAYQFAVKVILHRIASFVRCKHFKFVATNRRRGNAQIVICKVGFIQAVRSCRLIANGKLQAVVTVVVFEEPRKRRNFKLCIAACIYFVRCFLQSGIVCFNVTCQKLCVFFGDYVFFVFIVNADVAVNRARLAGIYFDELHFFFANLQKLRCAFFCIPSKVVNSFCKIAFRVFKGVVADFDLNGYVFVAALYAVDFVISKYRASRVLYAVGFFVSRDIARRVHVIYFVHEVGGANRCVFYFAVSGVELIIFVGVAKAGRLQYVNYFIIEAVFRAENEAVDFFVCNDYGSCVVGYDKFSRISFPFRCDIVESLSVKRVEIYDGVFAAFCGKRFKYKPVVCVGRAEMGKRTDNFFYCASFYFYAVFVVCVFESIASVCRLFFREGKSDFVAVGKRKTNRAFLGLSNFFFRSAVRYYVNGYARFVHFKFYYVCRLFFGQGRIAVKRYV